MAFPPLPEFEDDLIYVEDLQAIVAWLKALKPVPSSSVVPHSSVGGTSYRATGSGGGGGALVRIVVTGAVTAATYDGTSKAPTAWGGGRCKRVLGLNSLGAEETLWSHLPDPLPVNSVGWAQLINGELWVVSDSCSTV